MTRGYGVMGGYRITGKKQVSTHRVMAAIVYGPIPSGMHVCHTCDNVKCINPEHLFIGTPSENQQDSVRKGRCSRTGPRGHKFTREQSEARYAKMKATAEANGKTIGGKTRGSFRKNFS